MGGAVPVRGQPERVLRDERGDPSTARDLAALRLRPSDRSGAWGNAAPLPASRRTPPVATRPPRRVDDEHRPLRRSHDRPHGPRNEHLEPCGSETMNASRLKHAAGFHHSADAATRNVHGGNPDRFTYTFENFSHPFVEALITQLNRKSVAGMLDPKFLQTLEDRLFFQRQYPTHPNSMAQVHSRPHEIDVAPGGAYSSYNWELFYHVPVAIAVHLSKSQRFAEAQKWFHYVFDPTSTDGGPAPQRWWKFIAFRHGDMTNVEALIELLGTPEDELPPQQVARKQWVHNSYEAILSKPFDPHAVARARPLAYQYYV